MIKVCPKCGPRNIEFFGKKGPHKLQTYCRDCNKEYQKRHYKEHTQSYRLRNLFREKAIREYIKSIKESIPCTDCGNFYPSCVMDFDHKEDKKFNISQGHKLSITSVKLEIEKCELVCANCHRIRTHCPLA